MAKKIFMRFILFLFVTAFLFSCKNDETTPDVSSVKVNLTTQRFEQEFFGLDTNNIVPQLDKLQATYPSFTKSFLIEILGVDPRWSNDTTALYLKQFITFSRTIYDSTQKKFQDFSVYEKQIKNGLQYVKYYFPKYKLPIKIITFIGPTDGSGDGIGEDFLSIGLQSHLGKDFPIYKTDMVRDVYPEYVTANFTADFIEVNCMKNIIADMYPEKAEDKRLIIQMVEKGKRLYLLQKFLPTVSSYKLMSYTEVQMKDCMSHQKEIWDLFIQNNYLQIADNNLIKNYVSEGPKTQELGENAPGNIGSFAGWQIVKKYASRNPSVTPDSLMKIDNEIIYKEAKYKP